MSLTTMLPRDRQLSLEYKYSRNFIDRYIDKEIRENPETEVKVHQGVVLLGEWLGQSYYTSKQDRLDQIRHMDLEAIVRQVFIKTAYCQRPEPFTGVTGQLANALNFSDKSDAILTIAEIVAILCNTDIFDITKTPDQPDLSVVSRIPLSDKLITYVTNSRYLPPMVCEPEILTHNKQSAYLTHNDTLILGKSNHHNENISLDVINTQNSIPLSLNKEFLSTVEEDATFDLSDPKKRELWDNYKKQGYELYSMLANQGNKFWLTNKVDKRGRIYTQGYHVSLQGTAFKKASVDLYEKEVVTGVPA